MCPAASWVFPASQAVTAVIQAVTAASWVFPALWTLCTFSSSFLTIFSRDMRDSLNFEFVWQGHFEMNLGSRMASPAALTKMVPQQIFFRCHTLRSMKSDTLGPSESVLGSVSHLTLYLPVISCLILLVNKDFLLLAVLSLQLSRLRSRTKFLTPGPALKMC